eukprot:scaffold47750_cov54-Attheya_sp.AAC.1
MALGTEARFTSMVLFHRYIIAVASRADDLGMAAVACLFLGCKAEEEPRRLRDMVNVYNMLDFSLQQQPDPKIHDINTIPIYEADKPVELQQQSNDNNGDKKDGLSYWECKEKMVETEQAVLRLLEFDVLVSHPHRAVVLLVDRLSISLSNRNVDKTKKKLMAESWKRLNDALFSYQALQHSTLAMAHAALRLAARTHHIQLPPRFEEGSGLTDEQISSAMTSLENASNSLKEYSLLQS